MKKLILFLLLSINDWILVNSEVCPSGDKTKGKCSNQKMCHNKNHYCLEFRNRDSDYCCDMRETYCDYGMISFPNFGSGDVVERAVMSTREEYWHEMKIEVDGKEEKHFCPIPISWQLVDPKYTAVGYESDEVLKECTKNRDCKKGQFCGHTFNASFRDRYSTVVNGRNLHAAPFPNGFLDMSDNGKSLLFCYKVPEDMEDEEYDMDLESVGFTVCDTEADCGSVEAECRESGEVRDYLYFEADGRPTAVHDKMRPERSYNGVCLYRDGIVVKPKPPPTEAPTREDPATEDPATEDLAPQSAVEATYEQPKSVGSTILSMLMIKLVLLVFYLTQ